MGSDEGIGWTELVHKSTAVECLLWWTAVRSIKSEEQSHLHNSSEALSGADRPYWSNRLFPSRWWRSEPRMLGAILQWHRSAIALVRFHAASLQSTKSRQQQPADENGNRVVEWAYSDAMPVDKEFRSSSLGWQSVVWELSTPWRRLQSHHISRWCLVSWLWVR